MFKCSFIGCLSVYYKGHILLLDILFIIMQFFLCLLFSVSISSTLFLFSAHPGGFPPTLLHWRDLYQVINDLHFGKEKLILCPHFTWPFDSFGYTRSILRFWNTFFSRCLYLTPLDFPVSLATLFFLFLYWFLFFYETPLFFLVSLPLHIYCLRHHT